MAAALLVLSLACGYLGATGTDWYEGRDFHCFWAAGRIVASGGDPYDSARYQAAVAVRAPAPHDASDRCSSGFPYPLWTAVLLAPLGALPASIASGLWLTLLVASTVLGIGFSWRLAGGGDRGWPILVGLVAFSEPFWLALAEGQFGPLVLAQTAGAALAMKTRRDLGAGAAIASLAVKPHLSVISAPALLGRAVGQKRWRLLWATALAGLAATIVTLVLQPSWPSAWLATAFGVRADAPLATIWDLAASLGSVFLAVPVAALLVGAVTVLVRDRRRDDADWAAIATALSLALTPYARTHDFVVLALPWALILARTGRDASHHARMIRFAVVLVASPLAWALAAAAPLGRGDAPSALVPVLTALLVALSIRWRSQGGAARLDVQDPL